MKKIKKSSIILDIVLILMSLTYVLPIIMMISISFSNEQAIIDYGFTLFPKVFSTEAYKMALKNPYQIIQSYKVTIAYTVISVALSMFFQSLMAYPLSRNCFKYKMHLTVFLSIQMFFNDGTVATYTLNTQ